MKHAEIEALTTAFAPVIREFVEKALSEQEERIDELQLALENAGTIISTLAKQVATLALKEGPPGKDGKDGIDGQPGKDGVDGEQGPTGKEGPPGPQGPRGEIGIRGDDGPIGEQGMMGPRGPQGEPGKDGVNGRDGVDGAPGQDGAVGVAGRDGVDGVPGVDGLPGARGADGVPGVDGKDGAPGRDGRDGLPGMNGKDGKDGLGFDQLEQFETETQYGLKFILGTEARVVAWDKPKPLPAPTLDDWHKGVWKEGNEYKRGDCVALEGSMFVARADTTGRPATTKDWQLIVKRGNNGRDGKDGERGPQGPEGRPGRDLTQIGPDGQQVRRW